MSLTAICDFCHQWKPAEGMAWHSDGDGCYQCRQCEALETAREERQDDAEDEDGD